MRKSYAIAALLCGALMGHAAEKGLQIEFKDGTKAVYALASQPVVTFAGDDFTIHSSSADTNYPRADVKNFTFIDNVTSVVDVVGATRYSWRDNIFECPGHAIEVYSMAGMLMASGADSVSLHDFPAGIYIVRAGRQSIKIVTK